MIPPGLLLSFEVWAVWQADYGAWRFGYWTIHKWDGQIT